MTEIIGPEQTAASARLCPACGSPTIDINIIVETASCSACPWKGNSRDLIRIAFGHQLGDDERITRIMVNDLRKLLMKAAGAGYAQFLQKWGFVETPVKATALARYLQVIAEATLRAVIEERRAQVEKAHGKQRG